MERAFKIMPEDVHQMTILIYSPPNSSLDRHLISKVTKIVTEHYPERLGQLLIYPTGMTAYIVWAMISPFLPKKTSSKVHNGHSKLNSWHSKLHNGHSKAAQC